MIRQNGKRRTISCIITIIVVVSAIIGQPVYTAEQLDEDVIFNVLQGGQ